MKEIKIKCPAKINLDLRVYPLDKTTGFHPIKSIMQTINLFDYLTIKLNDGNSIVLKGNSDEIPYDEKNICYKAVKLFFEKIKKTYDVKNYIDSNPVLEPALQNYLNSYSSVLKDFELAD